MRSILSTAIAEIKFLLRNPPIIMLLSFAPIVYPFMYNSLYINKFETKLPIIVVDLDHSNQSRELCRKLDQAEQTSVCGVMSDLNDAQIFVSSNKANAVVVIPEGYEGNILRGEHVNLRAWINANRFLIAVDAGKGLSESLSSIASERLIAALEANGCTREQARNFSQPIMLRSEGMANTLECYGDYIIPVLLLLVLQQSLFSGAATASAGAGKHRRKFPSVAAPLIVIGRMFPYIALYSIYAALFFGFHYSLWGIPFDGSVTLLAALTVLNLCVMILAGFLLGSFCRSKLTALILTMFSSYPFLLFSGMAWPVSSMPPFWRIVSNIFPSAHYFPAAMELSRLNATFADVMPHFIALGIAFAVLMIALCVKYEMKAEPRLTG